MDTGRNKILTLWLLNLVLPASKVIKEVMTVLEETSLRICNAMEMSIWMPQTRFMSPRFPERQAQRGIKEELEAGKSVSSLLPATLDHGVVLCDFLWLCGICIHPTQWNHTSAFIVVTCVFGHTPTYWRHCQKEDIQQGREKPLLPQAVPWMWELCEHLAFYWAVSLLHCTLCPCRQPKPLSSLLL